MDSSSNARSEKSRNTLDGKYHETSSEGEAIADYPLQRKARNRGRLSEYIKQLEDETSDYQ